MVEFIKFNQHDPLNLRELGISFEAVSRILLGPPGAKPPTVTMYSPNVARDFMVREYKACDITYDALKHPLMKISDPVTGAEGACVQTFVPTDWGRFSAPVIKKFEGPGGNFGLAFLGLTSRVTHIILPDKGCVIFDLDRSASEFAWDKFMLAPERTTRPSGRRIGLVGMVMNYAHQAMNHLSGLQRIIDSDAADCFDEILVSGVEFFGPAQRIFPDLAAKIRTIQRADLPSAVLDCDVFRIGSNILSAGLRNRLLRLAANDYPRQSSAIMGRYPIIAFTVRTQGRQCLNLVEVIKQIVAQLLPRYPRLGVILDGWSFPETSIVAGSNVMTSLSDKHLGHMQEEARLIQDVCASIPGDVVLQILAGQPILQSINALQSVDAYVAHIGTLQHKIGWFTNAKGVVHGPTAQLENMDTGAYASEVSFAPEQIDRACVTDREVETARGKGFYDYTINDVSGIVDKLRHIIESR